MIDEFLIFQQKRRDRLNIIAEILEITQDCALKTQIMYRANLSFTQLNEYLDFMLRTRLLMKIVEENGKESYKATKKGLKYLQLYYALISLLSSEKVDSGDTLKCLLQKLE